MLDELDAADREAFRRAMQLLFGVNPHHKIPKPLLLKPVMRKWLMARLEDLGGRHKTIAKNIQAKSMIDWRQFGAFSFQKAVEGGVATIRHNVLGSAPLPPQLNFGDGEGWTIMDNHDGDSAKIDCGFAQVYLKHVPEQPASEGLLGEVRCQAAARVG